MLEGVSVAARPWFQHGLTAAFVGDVHEAALLAQKLPPQPYGEPYRFVDVATPLRDEAGSIVGVVGAHLSLTWMHALERKAIAPIIARDPSLEVLILSGDGTVILGPQDLEGGRLPADVTMLTARDGQGDRLASMTTWSDGRDYIAGVSRAITADSHSGLPWTVLVRQPVEVAFASTRAFTMKLMSLGAACACLFALIGWWAATRIAAPLLTLAKAAHALDGTKSHGALPAPQGYTEVGELTEALDGLLGRIAERDQALAAVNVKLETRVATRTRELASSHAFVRSILDASPNGILVLFPDGKLEYGNAAATRMWMRETDTGLGMQPMHVLWPASELSAIHGAAAAAISSGACSDLTTFCPVEAGLPRWLRVAVAPIHSADGCPERVLMIVSDITSLKAAEADLVQARDKAQAADWAKGEFLASMSHEIRTPLNAVIGFTGIILQRNDLPPDLARQVSMIQSSGNALLTVVNDVLDFSKIESGTVELESRPFLIQGLADNVRMIIAPLAEEKGLELAVEIDPRLSSCHMGDEDRLRQIFFNLINNAVKFTREGSVTLTLVLLDRTETSERILISVTDTGIGIAPEKIDRLFKRFSQVDGSIRREFGGTGLGLAISQRLVNLMGSEIVVSSEPWKGSTFAFTLSLDLADAAALVGPEPVTRTSVQPRRLLLAEDLPANQEIVRIILESSGHSVDIVGDGASAVRAVQTGAYDAVLMDVQMPVMDGLAATAQIRALPAPRAGIPIIALTANVLSDQVKALRAAGMDGHVGKPFRRADLLEAIERCCQSSTDSEPVPAEAEPDSPDATLDTGILDDLIGLAGPAQVLAWLDELQARIAAIYPARSALDGTDGLMADNHTLISQAGMLGFTALSDACRAVETHDRTGDDLAEPLRRCQAEATSAIAACRAVLDRLTVEPLGEPLRIAV